MAQKLIYRLGIQSTKHTQKMDSNDNNFTMGNGEQGNSSNNVANLYNYENPFHVVYIGAVFGILYVLVFIACFVGKL